MTEWPSFESFRRESGASSFNRFATRPILSCAALMSPYGGSHQGGLIVLHQTKLDQRQNRNQFVNRT